MVKGTELHLVETNIVCTGDESWPPACVLKFLSGDQFGHQDRVVVDGLLPGQCTEISLEMTSPTTTGIYQGQWRMSTPTGLYFGGNLEQNYMLSDIN